MKAHLLYQEEDFDLEREPDEQDVTQDLELDVLFDAMAGDDDPVLSDIVRRVVLCGRSTPSEIRYRQEVLADCLREPDTVRGLYAVAADAMTQERHIYPNFFKSPDTTLSRAVNVLELFVQELKRLRAIADDRAGGFRSSGFTRLFAMLATELDDAYFQRVEDHIGELRFRRGTLISARLGIGNKGTEYVLRRPREQSWLQQVSGGRSGYGFHIAERDESGAKALSDLRGRGIDLVANALAQSTDHILSFFRMLRCELAFYIGCLNLHERLERKGEPVCFPDPAPRGEPALRARGLYDVCLSLRTDSRAVGNDLDADGKQLIMITGANQGGKSTLLRGIGLAQLMMQCGMFVAARSFRADVRDGVFAHYKREEDASMTHGKLDEELLRMSAVADRISAGGMLLCNESFASTNEREGSEIARQIVHALLESGVKVVFVTHLFDLAHGLHEEGSEAALFLRAERTDDGRRTFRLAPGEPLPTSYGEDLYRRTFGGQSAEPSAAAVSPAEADDRP
ncbi:hypothetical protein [Streptomyces sp. NPDC059398]|uniref:MutS-related protein n=1 Tax=Streptomyces sp. NPDC059398 TaxID=3346820 RepID=UPI003695DC0B